MWTLFSKTSLHIPVQGEVFIKRERESRTKRSVGGTVQAGSVPELAIWFLSVNSCVSAVCASQGLEGQATP